MRRGRASLMVFLAGALAVPVVVAVKPSGPDETRAGAATGRQPSPARPFSARSPFNRAIPPDARVDPRSKLMVRGIQAAVRRQEAVVTWRYWSVPVYSAGPRTPRHAVRLTAKWAPRRWLTRVPIPAHARPDPKGDAEMVVVDRRTGCEYDFWQLRKRGGRWVASWANAIPIEGSGIYPKGLSARGSGFALLAGLIRPWELRRGRIDHALLWSYYWPKRGGPVRPATESDGVSGRRDAIPEGALIRLDPKLDLSKLKLRRYERIVARALQRYGAYLGDIGSGFTVYAQNPNTRGMGFYRGLLPRVAYPSLDRIPIHRLQVLRMPPQRDPPIEIVSNRCNHFR